MDEQGYGMSGRKRRRGYPEDGPEGSKLPPLFLLFFLLHSFHSSFLFVDSRVDKVKLE